MLIDHKDMILFLKAAILKAQERQSPYGQLDLLLEEFVNHSEQMEARDAELKTILRTGKDPRDSHTD